MMQCRHQAMLKQQFHDTDSLLHCSVAATWLRVERMMARRISSRGLQQKGDHRA
jgi:hypothetical protein